MVAKNNAALVPLKSGSRSYARLGHSALFKGVSPAEIDQFLERCVRAYFEKGDILLTPEAPNEQMHLLLNGSVFVVLQDSEAKPLATIGPGECVGEMSLFDGSKPSAYVIAAEDTETLVIDSKLLWDMINQSHEVAKNLLYLLSARIRSGNAAFNDSQALQKKTQEAADNDSLTGLHNRHWLDTLLVDLNRQQLQGWSPFSVVMFDVDHFKQFNDRFGHQVGDQVLQLVANETRESLRPNDLIARYGGEEFIVLLPRTSLKQCKKVAERLRKSVEQACLADANEDIPSVTISLGVAQWKKGQTAEELIGDADAALYRAKHAGRNCFSE